MSQNPFVPLVVIVALGGAGWYYRAPLMAFVNPSPPSPVVEVSPSSHAGAHKDTVYRWVDQNGVTHFDQENGAGKKAVEIDQSRIQSLDKYGKGAAPVQQASAAGQKSGNGGLTGAAPRVKENLNRAEDRFQQTHQDYTP